MNPSMRGSQVSDDEAPGDRQTKKSLLDLRTVVLISRTLPMNSGSVSTMDIAKIGNEVEERRHNQ